MQRRDLRCSQPAHGALEVVWRSFDELQSTEVRGIAFTPLDNFGITCGKKYKDESISRFKISYPSIILRG